MNARRASAARAALVLVALLAVPALAPGRARPLCSDPAESEARGGRTVEVACGARGGAGLRGPARVLFGMPIDANRADAETLQVIPGIGRARAAAILRARAYAPLCNPADLERVVGIGPRTRAEAARWMTFESTPECQAKR